MVSDAGPIQVNVALILADDPRGLPTLKLVSNQHPSPQWCELAAQEDARIGDDADDPSDDADASDDAGDNG